MPTRTLSRMRRSLLLARGPDNCDGDATVRAARGFLQLDLLEPAASSRRLACRPKESNWLAT